ncbi:hypothetical protein LEP1GSC133_1420 [Leptospira borgpetersenii serovar Pomona str. 200901868]|uniref:Uncharacterized protein n=1 Tax=Leptospira borgpetersenii serovar Pomona str. 200901868 TaxID=1192866 RepID=M6W831_LEPBO|nr:hypothetical protein LEP1GSC133_1420 [Leptospira borgpetersenii serovar Pomona str. 200901868]
MYLYIKIYLKQIIQSLRTIQKPEKKSAQSFYKFVIEPGNSGRSVIYGFLTNCIVGTL